MANTQAMCFVLGGFFLPIFLSDVNENSLFDNTKYTESQDVGLVPQSNEIYHQIRQSVAEFPLQTWGKTLSIFR